MRVILFAGVVLAACGGESSSDALASLDDVPRMTLVEEVRIGSTDDPGVGFTRIRDIRVEPGDRTRRGRCAVGGAVSIAGALSGAGKPWSVSGGEADNCTLVGSRRGAWRVTGAFRR